MQAKVRNIRQAGDTIIEVLIAIAVVSSVLGITYSVMNRNQMSTRTNQERTEASKLAQEQIEMLKGFVAVHGEAELGVRPGGLLNGDPFCMYLSSDPANPGPQPFPMPRPTYPGPWEATADDDMNYPAQCKPDSNGLYNVSIRRNRPWLEPGGARCSYGFTVSVRWFGLTSSRNEVIMAYKTGRLVSSSESVCAGAQTPS